MDDVSEQDLERLDHMDDVEVDTTAEVALLKEFAAPTEPRTMSRLNESLVYRLAIIDSKTKFRRSALRERYVTNILLMMRSRDGWGSEQMVRVSQQREEKERQRGALRLFTPGGSERAPE